MNRVALSSAFGVAVFGLVLLLVYVRKLQQEATGGTPVDLLVMRRDVQRGEPLTEDMLVVRPLPEAYVEDRHVTASSLPRVLGVDVSVAVHANQTLLWTDLSTARREGAKLSNRIPKGMRAMTIRENEAHSFSGLLRPGDRVDVLLTRRKPETEQFVTVPLLQNLLVLAVGDDVGAAHDWEAGSRKSSVSLLLTMQQAALLAHAQRDGTLRLVLRSDDDLEIDESFAETDDDDVLEREERVRRQRRVRLERVD